MSAFYDFRLVGAELGEGEIDVDDAVQILAKLQELATRIGRVSAEASHRGRPSAQVDRIARLRLVGLRAGSTVIQVTRASDHSELDFDLAEEQDFETRFDAVVTGILTNRRPDNVNESIAASASDLVAAFRRAAPTIEIRVDGRSRGESSTALLEQDTWRPALRATEPFVVEGRLEKVDIRSGDFRVRDALGTGYPLSKVVGVQDASLLIGQLVRVSGVAERNERGEVTAVRAAQIAPAADHTKGASIEQSVPLEKLLGADMRSGLGQPLDLTADEQDDFLDVMGL